ncbi:hydroxymethylbilane synthase, partial [Mitsuaria sp. TWR114]|uniref:hydroxymethylbilane synthase n=1 Tax=Mitsuaria sp. TWR114 TaxID=2601731 RepID=UPI0011BEA50D
LPAGFVLAAVLEREDPRDALVSSKYDSLAALPQGACVGTSSLRRVTQLKNMRPDLRIEPVRGNLDTRLRKLDEGQYDAIVLAAAGLKRLQLEGRIRQYFGVDEMIPCAGQGALGIEIRAGQAPLAEHLAALAHAPTWLAAAAERAVSRELGGSCSMPLAAHAVWAADGRLTLSAALGHPTQPERALLRAEAAATVSDLDQAEGLGVAAANALRERGAAEYLKDA